MPDAMSFSDIRCDCALVASAAEALCRTISLLRLMVSTVPRQLGAVCPGRFKSESRMYYVGRKCVKASFQGPASRFASAVRSAPTATVTCYNLPRRIRT